MIVITGAAGFIGSCLVTGLKQAGYYDFVLVDDFNRPDKQYNFNRHPDAKLVQRDDFFAWLDQHQASVQYIFHLGARTDTTEFDVEIHTRLNFQYAQELWLKCVQYGLPLVYASSAATYGDGSFGFRDDIDQLDALQPLNPYGVSKHEFDKWAIAEEQKPMQWVGLKFFNVYGPNEYHKGRMASVVYHAFHQIQSSGAMRLFKSHKPEFKDGEQLRDFIYVKDVVKVCIWLMENRKVTGLFNLGTGQARSFLDLTKAVFRALGQAEQISFIDTPVDIREKYQYFTEAPMEKLQSTGYIFPFFTLEEGVEDYVSNYLIKSLYY